MTNTKFFQDLENKAWEELNIPDHVQRFIKTMLIEHPENSAGNTITNSESFQLMRIYLSKAEEYGQPFVRAESSNGVKSDFFIDYEAHQGEL